VSDRENNVIGALKSFSQQIDDLEQARLIRTDGYVYDRQTLLHRNHIVDGGIGYGAGLLDSEHLSVIDALLREEGFEFFCEQRDGRRLDSGTCTSGDDPQTSDPIRPTPNPNRT
jgi:hypothetical protein